MANKLNDDLIEIVLKRNELDRLNYSSPEYDTVEEELHLLEDQFIINHGKYLEGILTSIHDELCPSNDVLLPIAYLAKKYVITKDPQKGILHFDPPINEGLIIDIEDYPEFNTRLVLVPNPLRILLQIDDSHREEVWKEEE